MTAASTSGETAVRVSPLRSVLRRLGVTPERIGTIEVSGAGREPGALADLSTCDRIGFKGRESGRWLESIGIALPDRPNRVLERADGLAVARLADAEFVLADFVDPGAPAIAAVRDAWAEAAVAGCYDVPRSESQAALGLWGPEAGAALAAVCPADLRAAAFGPGDVLQTTCAGVSAQLWNLSRDGAERRVLLCDASLAQHVWESVRAAVLAEGGRVGPQAAWFAQAAR
jgi:sarcosine oxidase subunit gamma